MDRRTIAFAAVMAALMLASAVIVVSDSEESDASSYRYTDSKSFTVGTAVGGTTSNGPSNSHYTWSTSSITGSVPGVSATYGTSGGHECINFSGTPSTANTYTVVAEWTCTSASGVIYEVGDTYKLTVTVTVSNSTVYTVYFAAGTGGYISKTSQSTTSTSGTFSCKATASSGYTFSAWKIGGQTFSTSATVTGNISQHDGQTLLATFTQTTYSHTLNYYPNAGTDTVSNMPSPNPATQDTNTNTAYSFTVSSTVPTRSGYTFLGWSESSGATSATYVGGNTISVPANGTKSLYAVWQQSNQVTYTISFNSSAATVKVNGTTVSDGYSQTVAQGTQITVAATMATGYTFNNWTIYEPDTGNEDVETTRTVTTNINFDTDFTLNATAPPSYSVSFSAYQSSFGSVSTQSVTVVSGTTYTVSGTTLTFSDGQTVTATPSSDGVFDHWSSSSGSITSSGESITAFFAKALWQVEFSTYPLNHGTFSPSSISNVPYGTTWTVNGNTITINTSPAVTVLFSPQNGYMADSWNPSSRTIGSIYASNTTYITTVLTRDPTATFTMSISAGTGGSVSPTTLSIPSGTGWETVGNTIVFSTTPTSSVVTATANANYAFDHWSRTGTGTVLSDMTWIASFTNTTPTDVRITLNYDSDKGSISPTSPTSFLVPYGTTWSSSGDTLTVGSYTFTATAASGYSFAGWSPASGTATSTLAEFITASFQEQSYTLTLSVNPTGAGSLSDTTLSVPYGRYFNAQGDTLQIIRGDGTVGHIENTVTATPASGYRFASWSNISGTMTGPRTITANFEVMTYTYTLNYNANGGSGAPASQTEVTTSSISASFGIPLSVPTWTGYSFMGWATSPSASSASYHPDGTFDLYTSIYPTRTATLYAVWMPAHTVTIDWFPAPAGSISPETSFDLPAGTVWSASGNRLIFTSSGSMVKTITATPESGFAFSMWEPATGEVSEDGQTITAYFVSNTNYHVDFDVYPAGGGTTTHRDITLPGYTTWYSEGDTLIFRAPTPIEIGATGTGGYDFHHWEPAMGTITGDRTITAVFDKDCTVIVEYNANCDLYIDGTRITRTTSYVVNLDNTPEIRCVPHAGYTFAYYSYEDAQGRTVETDENPMGLPLSNTRVTTHVVTTGDATVTFTSGGNGTVSPSTVTVPKGSRFVSEPNGRLHLSSNPSTVIVPIPNDGYAFQSWSDNADAFIMGNVTIQAYFSYDLSNAVWWANNYANNKATIVLDYAQTNSNLTHYMQIPLLKYDSDASDADPAFFSETGYILSIETGYNKMIRISLTLNGVEKYLGTYSPGVWQRYALILDTQEGTLSYQGISSAARNPMREFNFMDYTPIFTNVIADWSSVEDDLAFARIYHKDVGTGTNHPNFQIGNTATFLNTFGVVMIDPILNIYESFPAYENLRLNLYSFALYGDTITINNRTFEMDGSYIVIHYDKIGDRNMVSPGGTETFRAPLTNVYITWNNTGSLLADERQCYLTFAERNQTFDLGAFNIGDLTISGEGMWYFTTALWEPYDTVKKTYVMDWNSPFNLDGNGFLLIFIALLVVVLVIMNIFWQPTVLDYAVVFGAGLISLITLGTF